jgi:hypothetical protein
VTSRAVATAKLALSRKQLADQINYLGSDLNPSAAASPKTRADKLNAEGAAVRRSQRRTIISKA